MPYLERPDARIYFDDAGVGVPVITIHGFLENGGYWGRTGVSAALVDAGYRVLDMDMRGHGRSVARESRVDYSTDAVIADIAALADAHAFKRFHLLTHATGGMAGARYAMCASGRLLSLISTSTSSATAPIEQYTSPEWDERPVPPLGEAFGPAKAMALMLRTTASYHNILKGLQAAPDGHPLSPFFIGFESNPDPERCWRWTEDIFATGNPLTCADFADEFFRDPDPLAPRLRALTCASLVLIGEHDIFLRSAADCMARNIPGSEYIVLEGLGHMAAIEDPNRTAATIIEFLRRH